MTQNKQQQPGSSTPSKVTPPKPAPETEPEAGPDKPVLAPTGAVAEKAETPRAAMSGFARATVRFLDTYGFAWEFSMGMEADGPVATTVLTGIERLGTKLDEEGFEPLIDRGLGPNGATNVPVPGAPGMVYAPGVQPVAPRAPGAPVPPQPQGLAVPYGGQPQGPPVPPQPPGVLQPGMPVQPAAMQRADWCNIHGCAMKLRRAKDGSGQSWFSHKVTGPDGQVARDEVGQPIWCRGVYEQ